MKTAGLLSLALVLAGCASTGGIAPTQAMHTPAQAGAVAATDTTWPEARWWTAWGDAQLDALVAHALAEQPGLAAVQARIVQAEAAVDAAGAARRPQVNAAVDLTNQRFTENGMVPACILCRPQHLASAMIETPLPYHPGSGACMNS